MNIAVAGVGYVGLVTAASLAAAGHEVTCIDIDEKKIGLLRTGRSPIYENGLEELISQYSDRLNFTSDCSLYSDAEIIIIGVGTPELPDGCGQCGGTCVRRRGRCGQIHRPSGHMRECEKIYRTEESQTSVHGGLKSGVSLSGNGTVGYL